MSFWFAGLGLILDSWFYDRYLQQQQTTESVIQATVAIVFIQEIDDIFLALLSFEGDCLVEIAAPEIFDTAPHLLMRKKYALFLVIQLLAPLYILILAGLVHISHNMTRASHNLPKNSSNSSDSSYIANSTNSNITQLVVFNITKVIGINITQLMSSDVPVICLSMNSCL